MILIIEKKKMSEKFIILLYSLLNVSNEINFLELIVQCRTLRTFFERSSSKTDAQYIQYIYIIIYNLLYM